MRDLIKQDVEKLRGQIVAWRRDFHRHPEVAYKETETSAKLRRILESFGLRVRSLAGTGLRADLEGRPGGRTVALRSDMDALPLLEIGKKEYMSENPGACHACAHDGHMAILLTAARVLTERRGEFRGRIVFLFQPAEELPPGGAKPMIEEGALEGVDAIFGLHLWQSLPTGRIGIVPGPMMAASDNVRIAVRGKGGHGSMPHHTVDPILVASQIVVAMQTIVSRNIDPLKPAVVSFGRVEGGTLYNIIPNEVRLLGTARTFDPNLRDFVARRIQEVAEQTAGAFGAKAEVEYELGYPPLVNPPDMTAFVSATVLKTLGEGRMAAFEPIMGGEDFAYYLQKIPGAFFFFGAGDGMRFPHHHPEFDIDEKALPEAAFLIAALALEFLEKNEA